MAKITTPPNFRITLTGRTIHVLSRENAGKGIGDLLAYVLMGRGEYQEDLLRSWGIEMVVEADPTSSTPA